MHKSVKLNDPCEFINIQPINPLISKCEIKVCYVGDEPNRNGSVITKEVAKQMANTLPGSPIVGYFNETSQDFEEHNRIITISNGHMSVKDGTRPYGFVDLNAKVWFQKFLDDDSAEREYLMTEGWLWTGQYPETQRILTKGNAQSMELDDETLEGRWAEVDNCEGEFFIINEAIISKLCVLGEDVEPCFEGASVSAAPVEFSLDGAFKEQMYALIAQMQEILKGGTEVSMKKKNENFELAEEPTEEAVAAEEEKIEISEDKDGQTEEPIFDNTSEDNNEQKYSLEDIPEYVELVDKFSELEKNYNALKTEIEEKNTQINDLLNFKSNAERTEKENFIKDTFFMLSEEDLKEVRDNIDNYSLEEIEEKLSVICFRKRINFADLDNKNDASEQGSVLTYNLGASLSNEDSSVPEWIKAVQETEKKL